MSLLMPVTFHSALCFQSLKSVREQFQPACKSKGKECFELCMINDHCAKIRGTLVYNENIMYHKFNLHFSDFQITFNPICQCFLCRLKRHSQTNSFAAAASLLCLPSTPTVSHPHFSGSTSFPPVVGHSYLSYYFQSFFSSHSLALHFYRQRERYNAELTVCKCPFCVQCLHTESCSF